MSKSKIKKMDWRELASMKRMAKEVCSSCIAFKNEPCKNKPCPFYEYSEFTEDYLKEGGENDKRSKA